MNKPSPNDETTPKETNPNDKTTPTELTKGKIATTFINGKIGKLENSKFYSEVMKVLEEKLIGLSGVNQSIKFNIEIIQKVTKGPRQGP